jgi:hypothetical protein
VAVESHARSHLEELDNTRFAVQQSLQMFISVPQRRAMDLGTPMNPGELEAWARDVVNLFLNGCRG